MGAEDASDVCEAFLYIVFLELVYLVGHDDDVFACLHEVVEQLFVISSRADNCIDDQHYFVLLDIFISEVPPDTIAK